MPSIRVFYNAPRLELTTETDDPTYPTEQLELVHKEVDRQRAAIAARRNAFHTRAAVLVTAAGILATIQTTNLVNGWQFISVGLSVVAAAVGLWTMWPSTGDETSPKGLYEKYLTEEPFKVEQRIVEDSVGVLSAEMTLLNKIAFRLKVGYSILLGVWVSMAIIAGLKALTWI